MENNIRHIDRLTRIIDQMYILEKDDLKGSKDDYEEVVSSLENLQEDVEAAINRLFCVYTDERQQICSCPDCTHDRKLNEIENKLKYD